MIGNLIDAGSSNLVCSVSLANADHDLRLVFRYVDDDNYLLLKATGRERVELWAKQNGQWDAGPLKITLDAYTSGDRFEVRAIGTSVRAYRNGEPIVCAEDGRFRVTGMSCGLDMDDLAAVSGYSVTRADGPPPPVAVKLGPVPAYYPNDPRYFDPEF